jgi:hypothetical protein
MYLFARVVTINTRESALTKKIDFRHSKGAYRTSVTCVCHTQLASVTCMLYVCVNRYYISG